MPRSARRANIASLNDRLRRTGVGGRTVLTAGIGTLDEHVQQTIIQAVREFDAFTPDNDPHGEHDLATICVARQRIMWKIDYYDRDLQFGSPDPGDETLTCRVLTIMLAVEY